MARGRVLCYYVCVIFYINYELLYFISKCMHLHLHLHLQFLHQHQHGRLYGRVGQLAVNQTESSTFHSPNCVCHCLIRCDPPSGSRGQLSYSRAVSIHVQNKSDAPQHPFKRAFLALELNCHDQV